MVVGEDSEVTGLGRILSAAMDLTILAHTGILDFFITVSIAMAGFSAIGMISFSGIISLLALTLRHSDTLAGGTRMTIGIPSPMATMATHIPMITNHPRPGAILHRMEPNIGAI